jgi:hypothetical protein
LSSTDADHPLWKLHARSPLPYRCGDALSDTVPTMPYAHPDAVSAVHAYRAGNALLSDSAMHSVTRVPPHSCQLSADASRPLCDAIAGLPPYNRGLPRPNPALSNSGRLPNGPLSLGIRLSDPRVPNHRVWRNGRLWTRRRRIRRRSSRVAADPTGRLPARHSSELHAVVSDARRLHAGLSDTPGHGLSALSNTPGDSLSALYAGLSDTPGHGLYSLHGDLPESCRSLHSGLSDSPDNSLYSLHGGLSEPRRSLHSGLSDSPDNGVYSLHSRMSHALGNTLRTLCDAIARLPSHARGLPDATSALPSDRTLPVGCGSLSDRTGL